ncbi:hypothetical protein GCM10010471_09120 [Leucobacter komagatae]
MKSDDIRRTGLENRGWANVFRSWGAKLTAMDVDVDALTALVERGNRHSEIREIRDADLPSVLALDAATTADYPGGPATRRAPLTMSAVRASPGKRGFGAFDKAGRAIGVTFVDIDGQHAETNFTVVDPSTRGLGIASALKAASLIALVGDGVETFRTGGAAENTAILTVNTNLGYTVDEEWITLESPGSSAQAT